MHVSALREEGLHDVSVAVEGGELQRRPVPSLVVSGTLANGKDVGASIEEGAHQRDVPALCREQQGGFTPGVLAIHVDTHLEQESQCVANIPASVLVDRDVD